MAAPRAKTVWSGLDLLVGHGGRAGDDGLGQQLAAEHHAVALVERLGGEADHPVVGALPGGRQVEHGEEVLEFAHRDENGLYDSSMSRSHLGNYPAERLHTEPSGATMNIDDMVLVSVDDHVVEPPDLFDGPPARASTRTSRRSSSPGTTAPTPGSTRARSCRNVALNAVAGRPPEEYGIEPTSFDQLRPGCYDIDERVKDMDANGVLGSLCFPSFPQFCGQLFARTEDKDVALAMVRAYNDWHIDEWCGTQPGRFIPCSLPAIWDPEVLAAEVRRTAAKGAHAVTFSENPSKLGLAEHPLRPLGPVLEGVQRRERRGVHAHRLVVGAGHHVRRRPDGLPHHADPDEHRAGRGRPGVVAGAAEVPRSQGGALRGRHRLDPVLPRAGRLQLRPPPRLDRSGLRRQAAQRGVQRARADLLHRRQVRRGLAASSSTWTTSCGSATTPTRTRPGRPRPRPWRCRSATCPTTTSTASRTSTP